MTGRSRDGREKRRRFSTSAERAELNSTQTKNYAAGKTKMVAWFVSNCGPKNKRNDYARELAKYAYTRLLTILSVYFTSLYNSRA